jgi:hypothetical protein
MADFLVPDAVRDFITRYIDSVEALEVLLWLRRSGVEADASTVARELRSSVPSVLKRVTELTAHGLLQPGAVDGTFRYAPVAPGLDSTVALVADCYRIAPFRTMELVYSKPADKIQTFADAFKLKKEKD